MGHEQPRVPRCRQGGFTLIEILFVVGLFIVIGGVLLTLLMSGQTSYRVADTYIQVQQEARKALDQTVRELREAVNVSCGEAPGPPGDCTSLSPGRLNFQLLRYDVGTGQVIPGSEAADGQFVHYLLLDAPDLLVRYRSATAGGSNITDCSAATNCRVLARNVRTASFAWVAAAAARTVTLNLETFIRDPFLPGGSTDAGALRTGLLSSQVQLRNPDP